MTGGIFENFTHSKTVTLHWGTLPLRFIFFLWGGGGAGRYIDLAREIPNQGLYTLDKTKSCGDSQNTDGI